MQDPRENWDQRDQGFAVIEGEFAHYVKIAKSLRDLPSTKLATGALEEIRAAKESYLDARKVVDEDFAALYAVAAALRAAQAAEKAGTPDRAQAIKNREDLIAAEAASRYLESKLLRSIAATGGTRERLASACASPARAVVDETVGLVAKLFEFPRVAGAFDAAAELGRRSKSTQAQWWAISEQVAREAFEKRLARESALAKEGATGMRDASGNWVQRSRELPTAKDLETCFEQRRSALAAERKRLEAQIESMRSEVATMA